MFSYAFFLYSFIIYAHANTLYDACNGWENCDTNGWDVDTSLCSLDTEVELGVNMNLKKWALKCSDLYR
jgi:hypothetical protein